MRLHIQILAILLATPIAFAQGLVSFSNRELQPSDAPVTLADGTGPGETLAAGLYLVRDGALELLQTTGFRLTPNEGKKYLLPYDVRVPGIPSGKPATFRVRVWETNSSSFENAVATGACHGEFPTVRGNGEIFIESLGGSLPSGETFPSFLNGLLPLELPWVRSSTNASVLVPATKLRISRLPGESTLHFEVLTGFVSRENVIQSSPDLRHWTDLSTNVPSSTSFTFEQPVDSGEAARYYRAVVSN